MRAGFESCILEGVRSRRLGEGGGDMAEITHTNLKGGLTAGALSVGAPGGAPPDVSAPAMVPGGKVRAWLFPTLLPTNSSPSYG